MNLSITLSSIIREPFGFEYHFYLDSRSCIFLKTSSFVLCIT